MSDENTNEAVDAVTVEDAAEPASLTIQDLANLRSIIDVASQRGTFKPGEYSMVGDAYTKLSNFIQAITPAKPAEAVDATEATEASVAE